MRFFACRRSLSLFLLIVLTFLCGTTLSATTITVTSIADSGPGSLRDAMTVAQENDVITFADNVRGTIQIYAALPPITISVTIVGPGANLLTIDATNVPWPADAMLSVNAPGHAVSISGLTLANGQTNNGAGAGGGAIRNGGNLTLTGCVVTGCTALGQPFGAPVYGGAIFNSGSLEMIACTLSGNKAQGGSGPYHVNGGNAYGGALSNRPGATATLRNCTISGNQAIRGLGGCFYDTMFCSPAGVAGSGAIDNQGNLIVESCTIVSNSTTNNGGGVVISGGGGASFANTIIAQNTALAQPDVVGAATSNGFNLIGNSDDSTGFTATEDLTGTLAAPLNPLVGPLQDNGGPTATRALLPGSPAIDKGNTPTVTTDQRGSRRRDELPNISNATGGDASDIGAFEVRHACLLNISTRARVLVGENALIAGFIITRGQAKRLIVRGIGPSLSITGQLEDTTVEVYDDHGDPIPTAFNDNWMDATSAPEIAQSLPPANPLESALWGVINPTAYSVVLRGHDDSTGIALVEMYDLDASADSGLGNISTRGFVGTGNEVMICGFVVGPATSSVGTRIVLRALGPSLAEFGITNVLGDPMIDVRDANGAQLVLNDDWESDSGAATVSALGLAPGDSRESATIINVLNGAYTAIVQGASNGTGIGLVEAYDVGPE